MVNLRAGLRGVVASATSANFVWNRHLVHAWANRAEGSASMPAAVVSTRPHEVINCKYMMDTNQETESSAFCLTEMASPSSMGELCRQQQYHLRSNKCPMNVCVLMFAISWLQAYRSACFKQYWLVSMPDTCLLKQGWAGVYISKRCI